MITDRTKILFRIALLVLSLLSCDSLVSSISFFPKNDIVPDNELPGHIRHIQILTEDKLKINALHFSGKEKSKKLILYFHSNAENIYIILDQGERLFRMGVDVLLVSYRGYAGSRGKPSEKRNYADGKSAFNYAVNEMKYDQGGIIVAGRSIGTAVAVDISQNKDISGVLLISPLSSGIDFARSKYLGGFRFLIGNPFDSLSKINNIKCPILMIHGDRDKVISYDLGLKLYNAYKGKKEFLQIKTGDHNDLFIIAPDLYWSTIEKFIKRTTKIKDK